jgi:hypothetical protein
MSSTPFKDDIHLRRRPLTSPGIDLSTKHLLTLLSEAPPSQESARFAGDGSIGVSASPTETTNTIAVRLRDIDLYSDAAISLPPPATYVTRLQEWEGYVVHIEEQSFLSRLTSVWPERGTEEELLEFPKEDISETDLVLLRPGALFRWVVGYRELASGRERSSNVTLRRLPAWTKSDVEFAEAEAARVAENLSDDDADPGTACRE